MLRAIRHTPDEKPIDLILHTPGGLVLPATQIALALNDHPADTRVLIPHYVMSGGMLLALACNEVIMDPHAVLGPVDPQIQTGNGAYTAAASVLAAVEKKGKTVFVRVDVIEEGSIKEVYSRINVVCPGHIETPFLDQLDGKIMKHLASLHPIGKFREPQEEVAKGVRF